MKLIMENWRRFLQETANKEFLEEFQKIYFGDEEEIE